MTSSLQAIPEGSWILAIGANGFIVSHIILEFLKLGYKVRGTVRDISGSAWLTEELFQSYTANCSFELITFPDMAAENAFNDTIKDVSAVVQVAFVLYTISTQITPFLKMYSQLSTFCERPRTTLQSSDSYRHLLRVQLLCRTRIRIIEEMQARG
jgi:hypothetical protein